MKNKIQLLLNILFGLGLFVVLMLQFTKNDKIGYVNSALLLEKYEGMKEAGKELKGKSDSWQKNIDTLSSELQEDIKQYEKKLNTRTLKEQKDARDLIGKKQYDLMQYQEVVKKKKDEEDQRTIGLVLKEINEFLVEYGKKNGYKVILSGSKGAVAYAESSIDITEDVIVQLNKKYKGE